MEKNFQNSSVTQFQIKKKLIIFIKHVLKPISVSKNSENRTFGIETKHPPSIFLIEVFIQEIEWRWPEKYDENKSARQFASHWTKNVDDIAIHFGKEIGKFCNHCTDLRLHCNKQCIKGKLCYKVYNLWGILSLFPCQLPN